MTFLKKIPLLLFMLQIGAESAIYKTYHELNKYDRPVYANLSSSLVVQTGLSQRLQNRNDTLWSLTKNKVIDLFSAGKPISILHKTINAACLATTAFLTTRSTFYDVFPHKTPGSANPLRDEIMRSALQRFFTSPTVSFALMSLPLINYLSPIPFIGFVIPTIAQRLSFLARGYSRVRSMLGFYDFLNMIIKRRQERVKNPRFGINFKLPLIGWIGLGKHSLKRKIDENIQYLKKLESPEIEKKYGEDIILLERINVCSELLELMQSNHQLEQLSNINISDFIVEAYDW